MKTLLLGAHGQLGQELRKTAAGATVPLSPAGIGVGVRGPSAGLVALDRDELDITDRAAVDATVAELAPDVIVNAAAYTAVDRAESEPEAAFAINAEAAGHVAAAACTHGARLLHVSTDFVFDGEKGTPYLPDDATAPLSVYGRSKLDGERAVLDAHPDAAVVRTAWLYAAGGRNFVHTMLNLMRAGKPLRVVADQVGTPTWARTLAEALWALAGNPEARGVLHWTDGGCTTWYDFAVAIQQQALARGLLEAPVPITPIATVDYPTPARRPAYSVLDCRRTRALAGIEPLPWQEALGRMLAELDRATPSD